MPLFTGRISHVRSVTCTICEETSQNRTDRYYSFKYSNQFHQVHWHRWQEMAYFLIKTFQMGLKAFRPWLNCQTSHFMQWWLIWWYRAAFCGANYLQYIRSSKQVHHLSLFIGVTLSDMRPVNVTQAQHRQLYSVSTLSTLNMLNITHCSLCRWLKMSLVCILNKVIIFICLLKYPHAVIFIHIILPSWQEDDYVHARNKQCPHPTNPKIDVTIEPGSRKNACYTSAVGETDPTTANPKHFRRQNHPQAG